MVIRCYTIKELLDLTKRMTEVSYQQAVEQIKNNLDIFFKDVTNNKIPSFLYIDDRTICFKGNFEKTLEEIENFKVYWKN